MKLSSLMCFVAVVNSGAVMAKGQSFDLYFCDQIAATNETSVGRVSNLRSHVLKVIKSGESISSISVDGANRFSDLKASDVIIGKTVPAGLSAYTLGMDEGLAGEWGLQAFMNPKDMSSKDGFTLILRAGTDEAEKVIENSFRCEWNQSGLASTDPTRDLYRSKRN